MHLLYHNRHIPKRKATRPRPYQKKEMTRSGSRVLVEQKNKVKTLQSMGNEGNWRFLQIKFGVDDHILSCLADTGRKSKIHPRVNTAPVCWHDA